MFAYLGSTLFTVIVLLMIKIIYEVNTLTFINQCFLYGLAIFVAGISIFVYQTGFLDSFLKGFRQVYHFVLPKPRALIQEEKRLANDALINHWRTSTMNGLKMILLGIGTGSIFLSIAYLFIY
ncbi:DUF3899 domain-containing protein [Thermaerobacillus caldiproteolyticus]|uniref:DUF3899 domain-containing protein n=1 Tax=Thermaerobacillus caldiproteolyticus TaxID=247480 RepID=UPI00188A83CC|nr:DUF3899 domain-containing protein [Anoxybacillus caldiproteolyticus]QPA32368.1 DUF3899 domain-containing protein [Anoxybacillus caldiproteolyticus]